MLPTGTGYVKCMIDFLFYQFTRGIALGVLLGAVVRFFGGVGKSVLYVMGGGDTNG